MELTLARSIVRSWQPGDVPSLARHGNNRNVWRNVRDRFPHPYTVAHAREWIEGARTTVPEMNFAIVVDGEAAGGIGFLPKDDIYRRSVEIGYWLGEPFWGRGIATEAVRAMTDWAFAHFDICRVFAGVFEWNPASARVLEKAGYRFEGRLRKAVTKDGQTIDELVYAVIRLEP